MCHKCAHTWKISSLFSLIISCHWWEKPVDELLPIGCCKGFLTPQLTCPPPREGGQPRLAAPQFGCWKGRGWGGGGRRSCHGAQWVQSLWLECWKDCLVSVINGGELGGRSEGAAYVATLCNLNEQYRDFNESEAVLKFNCTISLHFFWGAGGGRYTNLLKFLSHQNTVKITVKTLHQCYSFPKCVY